MPLSDVVDLLACPACATRGLLDSSFVLDGETLRCVESHAYDVARQGYVNLLGHAAPANADSPAMVEARERFLSSGAYDPVADALRAAVARWVLPDAVSKRAVLDVGAGPGWYLGRVLEGGGRGLALDVSPAAARRAARSREQVAAVVADAWARLPVRSASVSAVLSVFAPRQPAELARVLAPGGAAVVVSPLSDHLVELRESWGLLGVEEGKQERIVATFGQHLDLVEATEVRYVLPLEPTMADDLVAMGPNAFHANDAYPDPPRTVTVAVQVAVWRSRAPSQG